MNDFRDLFTVERSDYKSFVNQIKPEARQVEVIELTNYSIATKIFSKKTGKCLCSRVSYEERVPGEERLPEHYYIFEIPDDDERQPIVPRMQVVLNSPEEVQMLLNGLAKMREEHKHGGNIP